MRAKTTKAETQAFLLRPRSPWSAAGLGSGAFGWTFAWACWPGKPIAVGTRVGLGKAGRLGAGGFSPRSGSRKRFARAGISWCEGS